MKIDKYFICHYKKLEYRKSDVLNQLHKYSINPEWILEYDQEDIDFNSLDKYYTNIKATNYLSRILRKSEISLILKHEECLKKIVENGYKNTIIFEDDIVLVDDFDKKLELYTNQLPNDYDILWIGSCCNLHYYPTKNNINVYKTNKGSRCTHAFLINLKCVNKILYHIKNIYYPIDFFYNKMVLELNLNNYWAEPELVSQNLNYKSSIQLQ